MKLRKTLWIAAALAILSPTALAQPAPTKARPEKIIIDTDIGDDIDDAFAIALALNSPEFEILGVSASFGDTTTRARLLDRFLGEAGRSDIPVAAGKPDGSVTSLNQRPWAEGGKFARASHPDSADFILSQIKKYPGQVTLVAIGPLHNIGAMIDKDPLTFRKVKRVVIMGGSVNPTVDAFNIAPPIPPHVEWNIKNDVTSAQKLFAAGVPLQVLPLDSTANLKVHELARDALFLHGSTLTDILLILYEHWSFRRPENSLAYMRKAIPTLYDPMTLASILDPSLCPFTPMHIAVDDTGMTRPMPGPPNAQVCLKSDENRFLHFYVDRMLRK